MFWLGGEGAGDGTVRPGKQRKRAKNSATTPFASVYSAVHARRQLVATDYDRKSFPLRGMHVTAACQAGPIDGPDPPSQTRWRARVSAGRPSSFPTPTSFSCYYSALLLCCSAHVPLCSPPALCPSLVQTIPPCVFRSLCLIVALLFFFFFSNRLVSLTAAGGRTHTLGT